MPRRDGAPRRSPHPPDLPVRADRRARPYRPRPVLEHRRAEPRVSLVPSGRRSWRCAGCACPDATADLSLRVMPIATVCPHASGPEGATMRRSSRTSGRSSSAGSRSASPARVAPGSDDIRPERLRAVGASSASARSGRSSTRNLYTRYQYATVRKARRHDNWYGKISELGSGTGNFPTLYNLRKVSDADILEPGGGGEF